MCEHDSYFLDIYRMYTYELPTSRLSKFIAWQTDKQPDRQTRPKLYITPLLRWSQNVQLFQSVLKICSFLLKIININTFALLWRLCQGWVAPDSPDLNPLEYQVWGNAGVLSQAASEAKNSSWV